MSNCPAILKGKNWRRKAKEEGRRESKMFWDFFWPDVRTRKS